MQSLLSSSSLVHSSLPYYFFALFSSRMAKVSFLFKTKANWICNIVHDSCIVNQLLKFISFIRVALFKTELQSA